MIGIGPDAQIIIFFVIVILIIAVPVVIIWKLHNLSQEMRGIRESLDVKKDVSDE